MANKKITYLISKDGKKISQLDARGFGKECGTITEMLSRIGTVKPEDITVTEGLYEQISEVEGEIQRTTGF